MAMKLPKPDIVIFDMDGTSVRHINPRLLHVMEWMDDAYFKISRFFLWLFKRHAKGPVIPDLKDYENRKKPKLVVHRVLHKVRRKSVEQIVEPCPGIYAVLNFLERQGIPMALVSNGLGKGYGHDILDKFDLEKFYRATIFREDIKKSKPHPEPILLALQSMGITVKDSDVIWYVGDRHKDVVAAIAADKLIKAKIEPVAYGLHAAMAIIDRGLSPDNIIMSYYDMLDHLQLMLEP